MKDPVGVCTRYEYDILGRRNRIYNDDGLKVRYETEENNHSLPNASPPNQMASCPTCEHNEGVHMNYANNK